MGRASFQAAKAGETIYLQIHGLGSMTNASTLEAFADKAIEAGARQFIFDLAQCPGIDSTFMGLLLEISNRLQELNGKGPRGGVLINVDEHAFKQLSSVGLDTLLSIREGVTELPPRLRLTEVLTAEVSERERLKLMVRVHRELVAADTRNKAKFGTFLSTIVAELEG